MIAKKTSDPRQTACRATRTIGRALVAAVLVLTCSLTAVAQTPQQPQPQPTQRQRATREQLADRQARHIAGQLALDDKAMARFVETYCDYQKELWALRPAQRPKKSEPRTDADVERDINARFDRSEKLQKLRRKYYEKYRKFLTSRQIDRIYQLERQELNRMAQRHNSKGKAPRPRRR